MAEALAPARRLLVSGNWKMNCNHFEALQLVQKLHWAMKPEDTQAIDVSVHPPFTDLRSVQTVLQADHIPVALGAQDCHTAENGAYTGEVSASMLAKLDVTYVIVGHSERRQLFGETSAVVAAKAAAVVGQQMTPIVCVGETDAEREAGRTEEVVTEQVRASLADLKAEQIATAVVAYEPIWAIGTGRTATPDDAQVLCQLVRSTIASQWSPEVSSGVRVQYGGSVKGANARDLLAQPDIDGALVGGASLDPEDFARIVAAGHAS